MAVRAETTSASARASSSVGNEATAFAAHCQITIPNYIDKFSIGAGGTIAATVGATGGASSVILIAANLPPRAHDVPTNGINHAASTGHPVAGGDGGTFDNGRGTSESLSIPDLFMAIRPLLKL